MTGAQGIPILVIKFSLVKGFLALKLLSLINNVCNVDIYEIPL